MFDNQDFGLHWSTTTLISVLTPLCSMKYSEEDVHSEIKPLVLELFLRNEAAQNGCLTSLIICVRDWLDMCGRSGQLLGHSMLRSTGISNP